MEGNVSGAFDEENGGRAGAVVAGGDENRRQRPFPLYSDPSGAAFGDYRSWDDFENLPLHGTFLIDGAGKLRWMDVGPEPFQEAGFLLEEAKRLLEMKN